MGVEHSIQYNAQILSAQNSNYKMNGYITKWFYENKILRLSIYNSFIIKYF